MTWNYRIIKYTNGHGCGLHEVYYDDDGKASTATVDPVDFTGKDAAEIISSLEMALDDAKKLPILHEDQI